jgi:beta-phosphoglucomutase
MLRAIIFDFDGVICDTEPLHYRAFARVLATHSVPLSEDVYFADYVGLNDRALLAAILDNAGHRLSDAEMDRLLLAKNEAYFSTIAGGVPRLPGVDEFVRRVAGRWPLAICSGARRVEIETILRGADLLRFFPVIVSVDEVPVSKPDPTGYLAAAQRLGEFVPDLRPGDCLVIEDSPHGIAAAKDAGMSILALQGRLEPLRLSLADATVPDLRSITDEQLAAMVG